MGARVAAAKTKRSLQNADYLFKAKRATFSVMRDRCEDGIESGKRPVARPRFRLAIARLKEMLREREIKFVDERGMQRLRQDVGPDYGVHEQCAAMVAAMDACGVTEVHVSGR